MYKRLYHSLLVLLATLTVVMTGNYVRSPAMVSADPGIMKWDTITTPSAIEGKNDVLNLHWQDPTVQGAVCNIYGYDETGFGNEIIDMAVGNDGMTIYFIARSGINLSATTCASAGLGAMYPGGTIVIANGLFASTNNGISASLAKHNALFLTPGYGFSNLYFVAVAPDDPKFVAVVSDTAGLNTDGGLTAGPNRIWVSTDGGSNWDLAFDGAATAAFQGRISDIDISIDYGGKRDIGFVTDSGQFWVRQSSGFSGWTPQTLAVTPAVNRFWALKFSPTYSGDSAVALVYTSVVAPVGTYFNVALRDLSSTNDIVGWAYGTGVEVNPVVGQSPLDTEVNRVSLQLPSDFSGQSASLRRAYISIDAHVASTGFAPAPRQDGIFRIDDTTVYTLMLTPERWKSIYSIAYFGTYASGKLLAGERWGYPCTATVPTWFTDSPTTCPIPCWYPALKPTTGAANQGDCTAGAHNGIGAALVAWNVDGSLGLVSTGSFAVYNTLANWWYQLAVPLAGETGIAGTASIGTPGVLGGPPLINFPGTTMPLLPIPNDENAFAISRNNGETWNQLSLIDTTIDWFNDVAIAPDCTTIYLASANRNTGNANFCNEFDSVWRATINPNVAAPLSAVPPLGTYWARVYCRVTSGSCAVPQSDLPILRVVPSCTDKPDGEIVGWAAQGARAAADAQGNPTGGGVMAWSPDFGDYWANVTPRFAVQDFAFESSSTIYVLSAAGLVQRLPYTGTSWSTNLNSYDTVLSAAHTIVAVPDGKVLVGAAIGSNSEFPMAYSADKGVTFMQVTDAIIGHGNEHVIFDVDFKDNSFVYMGDDAPDGTLGTVYRNTLPSFSRWVDNDMMSIGNNASGIDWPEGSVGPPHPAGIFGLVQAWTGSPDPAVYAAHDNITNTNFMWDSGVCRTLAPRDGMPKPGISWDCLDVFAPINTTGVLFTLEPSSLKYCGCCTLDTNTTLYAIDDESYRGNLLGRWNNHRNDCTQPWNVNFPGYTPKLRQGMLWAYTDCLAKRGPVLKSPADGFLVGADPVTGRNQQIDLSWEQLCLATGYLIQIAKDEDFTLKIDPTMNSATNIGSVMDEIQIDMDATNMTSPSVWIAPGALPEAGAIYYWHVCVYRSATGQLAWSDWSETRSFTVKAGFIVNTPYYGVQLLAPNNGCIGCKVKPASFSWSPWKEATKYQFDLAKDPEFKSLVVTATTTTTGYEYDGTLDYSTNYFWRVKALEVNGQNIPSDWSATFSLQTEAVPEPPAPAPAESATPLWVWVIIAIGAILVIVTLILVFKTRRV